MASSITPSIPKGTRDFSPEVVKKRTYILETIRKVYEEFGFEPIETPSLEKLSTLTGKYGDEGDRLIFKILNSGNYLSSLDEGLIQSKEVDKLTPLIAEKALRYDLTVPLARYVVQHQNELTFPFKRYQMQPVWRADRPQKGRYREFHQCDADVIGSTSLLNEAELIQIFNRVFETFQLPVLIKINNRKILKGIAEVIGEESKFEAMTVALDKLDKIGVDKVKAELEQSGLTAESVVKLEPLFEQRAVEAKPWSFLKDYLKTSEIGMTGIRELEEVFFYLEDDPESLKQIQVDYLLARGLDYYTGAIFEVVVPDSAVGSVCGGGRYDDLTGIFGVSGMSGVGISFGVDRIYDSMEGRSLFDAQKKQASDVMFTNFGKEEIKYMLPIVNELRRAGLKVNVYPDASKMKKQFKYADAKSIPYVVMAGSEEIEQKQVTLKNMRTGDQEQMTPAHLIQKLTD